MIAPLFSKCFFYICLFLENEPNNVSFFKYFHVAISIVDNCWEIALTKNIYIKNVLYAITQVYLVSYTKSYLV